MPRRSRIPLAPTEASELVNALSVVQRDFQSVGVVTRTAELANASSTRWPKIAIGVVGTSAALVALRIQRQRNRQLESELESELDIEIEATAAAADPDRRA
jgi:hypothetical protein